MIHHVSENNRAGLEEFIMTARIIELVGRIHHDSENNRAGLEE